MAKSEKMTQRELKQPDAFQRVGAEARDWLVERQSLVLIAVGVLVVAGLVAALASYFSSRAETKAAQALSAALEILERPSNQERDQALVKELTDFRAAHKGTPSAATAALALGKAEYRLGNHDGALAAFGEYLKSAPPNDPLRASALEGQGYAYEAQKKYDQALASFEEMSKADAGGYLEGMGQYHRARILILQGKKEEAASVLVKIPVDHPNSAASRLATERTALLTAEGVKIPEPAAPAAGQQDGGA